jgi:hypothetical protein
LENTASVCSGGGASGHGLKAAYLNGEIGETRSFDNAAGRYGVYFEDKSINPKSVKLENLRIMLELPEN